MERNSDLPADAPMVHVVPLVKESGDVYFFIFDKQSVPSILQTMGRFAADAEHNFSWYDTRVVNDRIRGAVAGVLGNPHNQTIEYTPEVRAGLLRLMYKQAKSIQKGM